MTSQGLQELLTAPSCWQTRLACRQVYTAPVPLETDVAIIGAGLSGLAAAQRALEAGLSVTVLEAGEVGQGASGRNSGFVVPVPARHTPGSLQHLLGNEATAFMAALQHTLQQVFSLAPADGSRGWVQPLTKASAVNAGALAEGWRCLGVDVALLEDNALAQAIGTTCYTTALHFREGGAINPLGLVQQLGNAIYRLGGSIIEHCPVTRIKPHGRTITVETPAGHMKAGRVFIAGNAYGTGASHITRRAIGPIPLALATFTATCPVSHAPLPFSDNNKDMWFARWLDNRTVLTGCFALPLQRSQQACTDLLQTRIERLYGHRPEAPHQQWAGWVGLTPNGLPTVHDGDDRIISWSGCNGRGIALSVMMGRTLVDHLCGSAGQHVPLPGGTGWQKGSVLAWLAQAVIAQDRYRQHRALIAS